MTYPSRWDYLGALSLPFIVLILVPGIILWLTGGFPIDPMHLFSITYEIGLGTITAGAIIVVLCIRDFSEIGKGTLAPWAPTQELVVTGLYRYVRNPMIMGVLVVIVGESLYFASPYLFLWFLFFLVGNHIYFIKSEEPGLVKQFGQEYIVYCENVPRWIPRRTPWSPESKYE